MACGILEAVDRDGSPVGEETLIGYCIFSALVSLTCLTSDKSLLQLESDHTHPVSARIRRATASTSQTQCIPILEQQHHMMAASGMADIQMDHA